MRIGACEKLGKDFGFILQIFKNFPKPPYRNRVFERKTIREIKRIMTNLQITTTYTS